MSLFPFARLLKGGGTRKRWNTGRANALLCGSVMLVDGLLSLLMRCGRCLDICPHFIEEKEVKSHPHRRGC